MANHVLDFSESPNNGLTYCFGEVTYLDTAGGVHHSRFAREYNPVPQRVIREAKAEALGDGVGWLSAPFDSSAFTPVGGKGLNWAD